MAETRRLSGRGLVGPPSSRAALRLEEEVNARRELKAHLAYVGFFAEGRNEDFSTLVTFERKCGDPVEIERGKFLGVAVPLNL